MVANVTISAQNTINTSAPPLGWNSYDCYGKHIKVNEQDGWIGVFNKNEYKELIKLDKEEKGLDKSVAYYLYDIWGKRIIKNDESFIFEIPGDDVIFIRYKAKKRELRI